MSFIKGLFGRHANRTNNSVEASKRRHQAAMEVLKLFDENFKTTFESHPATVLHAAAWLAGTSLFRSFGINTQEIAPGNVILSDKANEEGPKILNIYLYAIIEKSHIKLNPKDMILNFPPDYKPKKDIIQIQELFQDTYNDVMKKYGFDYLEGAQVGAFICGIITHTHCIARKDLDPRLAAGIVAMGLVEGAKTAPIPLKS